MAGEDKQERRKLMRVTTSDISLDSLLTGQLRFLSRYYDVVGVAADSGRMDLVREREGVRCVDVPMHREISLSADLASLFALIRLQDDIIYVLLTLFFNLSYSGLLIVGVSFFRIRS